MGTITLDKTRDYGTVFPPEQGAHYSQDGFYFDHQGDLVENEWLMGEDGVKRLADMKKKAEASAAALAKYNEIMGIASKTLAEAGIETVAPSSAEEEDEAPADLVKWAKGQERMKNADALAAAKAQYNVVFSNTGMLVAFMIEEGKIAASDVKIKVQAVTSSD